MQSRVSFDTKLRIALRSKWVKMAEDGKKKTLLVSTKFFRRCTDESKC